MKRPLLFIGLGFCLVPPIQAGTDVVEVETTVVYATRLQQNVYETGSSVYVIDGQTIEAGGYDYVVDAIAAAPGVTVNQNGAFGGSATVRIRGASSEQTLVLIDGIVVNDTSSPGGGYDFGRLDPASIERIEILRGPQSTLWGSDAIGGVVSIVTKRPVGELQGSAFFEYGSQATARGGVEFAAASEFGDFRIGVTSINSDGVSKADENNGNSEEDGYESVTIGGRGGLNLPGGAVLDLSLTHTSAETDFDSFVFGAQGNVGDGDEHSETDELNGQLTVTVPSFDGRLVNTLTYGYSEIERDSFSNGVAGFSAEGERQIFRYNGRYDLAQGHKLAFGAEREATEAGSNDARVNSFYGLYEFKPTEALTLTLGTRSDDIEDGDSEVTSRVALAYQANDNITLRGSWGEGFKAPTLFQTTFFCCGAVAPNPDLQPEESDAFDLGVDWRSANGVTAASLTYFNQDITNKIDFSFALGGYENIARAESDGVELMVSHKLIEPLTASLTFAYIDAVDGDGNRLNRVPEKTADLRLSYQASDKLSINATIRYNDEELDSNGTLDSGTRGDLSAQYALSETITLFARIENLADTEYQQIIGYGSLDRYYSAGLRARF